MRSPTPTAASAGLAGSFLALYLLVATAAAQEPPAEPFEDRLEVREILLDVLVTDEEGNVVVGLDKEDFLLQEDGEDVPVESVSFYSNRTYLGAAPGPMGGSAESAPASLVDEPFQAPEDRYFLLLFFRPPVGQTDDNRLYQRLPQAGRMAYDWLIQELLPNDHVAVAAWDTDLRLHHDFTRDRHRLGLALRSASRGKAPESRWPSRSGPGTPGITLAPLVAEYETGESRARDFVEALQVLGEGLGSIPGRKNLILFGVEVPDYGSWGTEKALDDAVETFNAANVAVYTIGVTRRGHQESLAVLARETGGEYLYRFRDFRDPLRRISRQNSGFYLLSFRSRQPAEGQGYRPVEVRTVNEEFLVRARGGYRYGG